MRASMHAASLDAARAPSMAMAAPAPVGAHASLANAT
jgi:hypothetical protein